MKKYEFNEITLLQFICINLGIQVSVGALSLPQRLALKASTDGWMAIILMWAITIAASWIIIQIMKKYPDGTLPDLLSRYLGKWVGKAVALAAALYFLYYAYVVIVSTILYTKQWLLPRTPGEIIMLLFLIPAYAIASKGLRVIGRYAEVVILLSGWMLVIYMESFRDAYWLHLRPFFKEGWYPVIAALPEASLSFIGFASLFILYPFLQNKQQAFIGITVSSTLSMLVYLFTTIICFVYFSPDQIMQYNDPVVTILKVIKFRFVDRIEVLFISFYLFMFSLSWITTIYFSVFCTSWALGKQDHRGHLRILLFGAVAGTYFFMPTEQQKNQLEDLLMQIGIGFEYAFPVCLLIYLWLHERVLGRIKR
ncbi:GerAB/ArcD/ProY family transporter [Paenibacillus arenilitoris]|uniref:Endospore germination permease n=1 Tax=Paenibacillus arenilitoris TaxID=2772299 RepID=A0A927CGL8_9BACL|nr:endospore germination permease [Paenibacillus arenilitoris]MBD2867114.1 endospore germination permease [Paenibacillus arenilitoris]